MKLLFKSRNNHKNKMENEERTSEIKNSFPEKSHKHSTPENTLKKYNSLQEEKNILLKENEKLISENRRKEGIAEIAQFLFEYHIYTLNTLQSNFAEEQGKNISKQLKKDLQSKILKILLKLDHNFTEQIRKQYPTLSQNNLVLALLLKLNCKIDHIAFIYSATPATIRKRKSRLAKLFCPQNPKNLYEFLTSF
ncbi:hypothetical protein CE91St19_08290 [Odoribacter laneus]|jgi:hypothetical protein|uniref:HTH luxR-type domain-containing protein n=1 Tax=Odoribacter laneus YIT 12061 TaxID=742817 RepID=H1DIB5_9BACT|nr:hypothetical protein [Odoribacter laneus]EHP46527.1 hypothetical protein HMPREF9449_02144 [Odoribacter laneus YIT 12061]GKI21427.1 hypothetical protein CE91St19_08290 [Odoribacter laneus]GKI26009.1 hypothetical protein CE91St20_21460 [Odoribacter laneus]